MDDFQRYLSITEQQKQHKKKMQSAEKDFKIKLASAIKATESKYTPLSAKSPLDLIYSFYLERLHCYTAMLYLDTHNPGIFLTLNDILTLPNEWKKPSDDFWLSLTSRYDRILSRIDLDSLLSAYVLTKEPKAVLRLGLSSYWTHVLLEEIDRRAKSNPIGKDVWIGGVTKAFQKNAQNLTPKHYHTPDEAYDRVEIRERLAQKGVLNDRQVERENRAFEGFKEFVTKKEKKAVGQVTHDHIKNLSSAMLNRLPSDWYQNAERFLENDFKGCVSVFYPIITGDLEAGPLAARTYFREHFRTRTYGKPQIVIKDGKRKKHFHKVKHISFRESVAKDEKGQLHVFNTFDRLAGRGKMPRDKLYTEGLRFNPERLVMKKQQEILRVRALDLFDREDPKLFQAYFKHGQNIKAIADALSVSRPTVYSRIKRLKQVISERLRIPLDEIPFQI